jgi:hypothetical protein
MEQGRIRENMSRLEKTSDLYKRYACLLDEQEDLPEGALSKIDSLLATEKRQQICPEHNSIVSIHLLLIMMRANRLRN